MNVTIENRFGVAYLWTELGVVAGRTPRMTADHSSDVIAWHLEDEINSTKRQIRYIYD